MSAQKCRPRWILRLPHLIPNPKKRSKTYMPDAAVRELTFGQAVREALAEEMRRDSTVCVLGEDVAEAGTPFKVLSGLVEEFGTARVIDTPISEAGFTGVGVGAAMTGMRPVIDIMFGDFLTWPWISWLIKPPRFTICQVESGKCPWSCALLLEPPGGPPRNTRNPFMPGSATCPALRSSCPQRRMTQKAF